MQQDATPSAYRAYRAEQAGKYKPCRQMRSEASENHGEHQKGSGPSYVGPTQVAEYFGIHPSTVRRACESGEIEGARKIGRQWRIPISFLKQSQVA